VRTASELRQAIDEAHERFFAALEGFDDTVLETQPICGVWSARDVAGHLADWHNEMIDTLERVRAGQQPKRPIRDIDSWNHDQAALRGIDTWAQAADDLRVAWKRVTDTLADLDESELERVAPLPSGTVDRTGGFFRRINRHTRTHAADAETWRMRMLGVRDRAE
jgi:uncharacterized damage-inducible protein DinB